MKIINTTYTMGAIWDETDAVKTSARQAVDVMKRLFEHRQVSRVSVSSETKFTDQYGKESVGTVVRLVWSRKTADKVEWKNFADMVLADYKRAFAIADQYYIHAGVWQKLKDRGNLLTSGGTGL